MDTTTLGVIIIAVILCLSLIVYLLLSIRLKKINTKVPDNIKVTFNDIERRYTEADGRRSHEDILWEVAREHFRGTLQEPSKRVVELEGRKDDQAGRSFQSDSNIRIEQPKERIISDESRPGKDTKRNKPARWNPI